MLTTLQSVAIIGRRAVLGMSDSALRFDVRIVDAKNAYGCTRVLVEPIAGGGRAWVGLERMRIEGVPGGI